MIFGYVGEFGAGKTLNMVFDIMRQMIYWERHVFSNIPIEFYHNGRHYKADFIDDDKVFAKKIFDQRNTDIVVDEAGIYFPNFFWNKIPPKVLMQFHEQRKTGCNFYYTTQVNKHTVKRMRDLSYIIAYCYSYHILPINIHEKIGKFWLNIEAPKLFVCKYFKPSFFEGNSDSSKRYERYYRGKRTLYPSDSKRVFKAYKTNFLVDSSPMNHEKPDDIPDVSKIIIAKW
jgi:hypothetical protein